ncbi:lmo0937 family membrane protein [Clostridium estertheticum]|nr:lmo0937 family membrane protein [Clostridium estertheticum]MBX4268419.1 lmo0937 family membrane protein [Clostridium estertheticum]WLC81520.1 lmo0937 family membrane protein [Clostridium estertheticum]
MGLLRTIVGIMIILWLLGFVLHIGGGMIHTLLVIAVIIFVFDLIGGRRR